MFFAIISDADTNENVPFAAHSEMLADVTAQICRRMHTWYSMPLDITTLEHASAWFSGCAEDGEPVYGAANPYNAIWWWDTNNRCD